MRLVIKLCPKFLLSCVQRISNLIVWYPLQSYLIYKLIKSICADVWCYDALCEFNVNA